MNVRLTALLLIGASAFAQQTAVIYDPLNNHLTVSRVPVFSGSADPAACNPAISALFWNASSSTLRFCNGTNTWADVGGSGGGGGAATAAYQLTDMKVTKTSGSVWTINATAGVTTPIIWGAGNTSYVFTTTATATTSGTSNTGNVYVCFNPGDGTIHFRHNTTTTITGSGVTVDTGQTSCGATMEPLWTLTMTANVPDAMTATMDKRAVGGRKPSPTAGNCITITSAISDTIAVDGTQAGCGVTLTYYQGAAGGSSTGGQPGFGTSWVGGSGDAHVCPAAAAADQCYDHFFEDAGTHLSTVFGWQIPKGWVSGAVSLTVYFGDDGGSNTYQYSVQVRCQHNNQAFPAYGSVQNFGSITTTASRMHLATLTPVTMPTCAELDQVQFKIAFANNPNGFGRFYGLGFNIAIP